MCSAWCREPVRPFAVLSSALTFLVCHSCLTQSLAFCLHPVFPSAGGPYMIGPYTNEQYLEKVLAFHGHAAPGVLLGGHLVAAARAELPENCIFDALSESAQCLPDAVQILTPCTAGNSWLKICNAGIFAVVLYDKYTGAGVRAWLDTKKLEAFPQTWEWFFKLKPKKEQDGDALRAEILEHGAEMISTRAVQMKPEVLVRKGKGAVGICPKCGEGYPVMFGELCPLCAGGREYAPLP